MVGKEKTPAFIFDIQRAAMHDGPGIRTTVFMKGCPLRCKWCHNPESQSTKPVLKYVERFCVGCKACQVVCPNGCHVFDGEKHLIDRAACSACGMCVENCAFHALSLLGKYVYPSEIVSLLEKDRKYFDKTNGGLTISGGEPLVQPEACMDLLREAKEHGFHTCLDTSGFAPEEVIREMLPFVDIFLFDYKITSAEKHKEYTGVDNALILSNLRYISEAGARIILRCPIIPGVNDDDEHLEAITALSEEKEGIIEVDLMFYHNIAKGKIPQVGFEGDTLLMESVGAEYKKAVFEKMATFGCKKLNQFA